MMIERVNKVLNCILFLFLTDPIPFDVDSVQRHLKEIYKNKLSKIQQISPDIPKAMVHMEDIFVDLELIEEEKSTVTVKKQNLTDCADMVTLTDRHNRSPLKRVLLRGNAGVGKTTAMNKLAYCWATSEHAGSRLYKIFLSKVGLGKESLPESPSSLADFRLVFKVEMKDVPRGATLVDVIAKQLLPPHISKQSLQQYLQENGQYVLILLDGYDEVRSDLLRKDFEDIFERKTYSQSWVIVSTRTNKVDEFVYKYTGFCHVNLRGFVGKNIVKYVFKFFEIRTVPDFLLKLLYYFLTVNFLYRWISPVLKLWKINELQSTIDFLRTLFGSDRLSNFSVTPLFLCMLSIVWRDDQNLPTSVSLLYRKFLLNLETHRQEKKNPGCLDEHRKEAIKRDVEIVLFSMGKIALDGLFEGTAEFIYNAQNKQLFDGAHSMGIIKVPEEEVFVRKMTSKHVTFLHKTFQEICAAVYLANLAKSSDDAEKHLFNQYLSKITATNVDEYEYLLRFCCGDNTQAAARLIPTIVEYKQRERLESKHNCLFGIGDPQKGNDHGQVKNPWRLPLMMLFEADNNEQPGASSEELHLLTEQVFQIIQIHCREHKVDTDLCIMLMRRIHE